MTYLLDTNVILYYLGGRLARPLPDGRFYTSVITELELLSYRHLSTDDESTIRAFLAETTIIGLDTGTKEAAIRLRRMHRLKLPDAIVGATALTLGAHLLTCDDDLLHLDGLMSSAPELSG